MKRSLAISAVMLVAACAAVRNHGGANPYEQSPFYAKYLNTGSQLDAQITATLDKLNENPWSAALHNELGALLVQKNFPKDAAVEFQRAIDIDKKFYTAWYNLGLVRASLGDDDGSNAAMERTVSLKPGHPQALFQLGLNAEHDGQIEKAVGYYSKAYMHNARMMDVRYNPRILDSKLTHLALIKLYDRTQARQSMTFQGPPAGYVEKMPPEPQTSAAPTTPAPTPEPAPQVQPTPPPPPPPTPTSAISPVTMTGDPLTQTST